MMNPAGLEAFSKRKEEKSGIYSFEGDAKNLSDNYVLIFKANQKAWDFFSSQATSYKKTVCHWIMTARQELTRISRLERAMAESANQKRLWDKYK